MNLIENSIDEKKDNSKKIMMSILISIGVLVILAIVIISYSYYLKTQELKFYINNEEKQVNSKITVIQDNILYINVKSLASFLGYEYNNGEYNNPYIEDKTKCYVKTTQEVASFVADSNIMYKVVLAEDENIEYYNLQNKVILVDGEIFATEEAIELAYNVVCQYDENSNTIKFYTLNFLENSYSNITGAVIGEESIFDNKKLLKYNMILTKNSEGFFGVRTLANESIIGNKYTSIKFIESSMDFVVTTEEAKQGILTLKEDGSVEVKISPEYTQIMKISNELDLYLVSAIVNGSQKYGVISGNEKLVIYIEYDKIGIDTSAFLNNNINSQYILYDNCIPVMKDR